jgi:hypothetical protein
MPATRTCPTCESEVPSDSPNEQCPRCLLELGLQDESTAPDGDPAPAELQGIDAVIDTDGTVTLLQPVRLPTPRRALVTILGDDDWPAGFPQLADPRHHPEAASCGGPKTPTRPEDQPGA